MRCYNKIPTQTHHHTISYLYNRNTYKGQHLLKVAPEWCLHCLSKKNETEDMSAQNLIFMFRTVRNKLFTQAHNKQAI